MGSCHHPLPLDGGGLRQVGSVAVLCLVAGCDGRSYSRLRFDSRGHHGDGRGVPLGTHFSDARIAPCGRTHRGLGGRCDRIAGCHHWHGPVRHQACDGVFNCVPVGVHVHGCWGAFDVWRGRARFYARLLQGRALFDLRGHHARLCRPA